ncbi:MAG: hypothetical protein ACKO2L_07905 [Planctomycetaceae bacterium]
MGIDNCILIQQSQMSRKIGADLWNQRSPHIQQDERPEVLAFWQELMPGERGWDDETVLRTPDFVLWIRSTETKRSGVVNPLVTLHANVARTASGTHQGRTGRLTSTARHTALL